MHLASLYLAQEKAAKAVPEFEAAREIVRKGDLARNRYLKDHFHADIDDPLLYDLVINTARLSAAAVARVIAEAVGRQPREG